MALNSHVHAYIIQLLPVDHFTETKCLSIVTGQIDHYSHLCRATPAYPTRARHSCFERRLSWIAFQRGDIWAPFYF